MIHFLLTHTWVIGLVVAGAIVGGFALLGPAFGKFLLNPKVLLAGAVAAGLLAFASLDTKYRDLKVENALQETRIVTVEDGQAAVTFKMTRQAENAKQATRLQEVIDEAPEGQAVDAVMDEIARQDAGGDDDVAEPDAVGVRDDGADARS